MRDWRWSEDTEVTWWWSSDDHQHPFRSGFDPDKLTNLVGSRWQDNVTGSEDGFQAERMWMSLCHGFSFHFLGDDQTRAVRSIRVLFRRFVLIPIPVINDPPWCGCCVCWLLNQWRLSGWQHLPAAAAAAAAAARGLNRHERGKKRALPVDGSDVWGSTGAGSSPGRVPPHRLRMEGEAVRARAAFITTQRGNVDRNQRSPVFERMSHSAASTSPSAAEGFYGGLTPKTEVIVTKHIYPTTTNNLSTETMFGVLIFSGICILPVILPHYISDTKNESFRLYYNFLNADFLYKKHKNKIIKYDPLLRNYTFKY